MAEAPSAESTVACPACGAETAVDARFCPMCGGPMTQDTAVAEAVAEYRPQREPERRQLTVLFCDLAGSTALSEQLDPEDLRDIILAYQGVCASAVTQYGGIVARFVGDGVLAYFGYPEAHEDDAERAVHGALEIVASIAHLSERASKEHGVQLTVRLGIATGLVVVGDLIGERSAEETAVVGMTPNLAARMQALAELNNVVISDDTQRLVRGVFDCEDLGEHVLKGIREPQRVWRVRGQMESESRFQSVRSTATPFLGRRAELDLLLDRWHQACAGEYQVVLVSGNAGIGKSRLLEALREQLDRDSYICLRYQCSPYHENSALYPVIKHIEKTAGISLDQDEATKLRNLAELLGEFGEVNSDALPLFAELLSIQTSGTRPLSSMSPERKKVRRLTLMVEWVSALARHKPVLVLLEDTQWIDPTTLELLTRLAEPVRNAPVMLLATARGAFAATLAGLERVNSLSLGRLPVAECETLVTAIVGVQQWPDQFVRRVVEQADGVPLYLEELTKTLLEQGRQSTKSGSTGDLPIPVTLQDSLTARLDQTEGGKRLAQIGAVIGREFTYKLIAAVSGWDGPELNKGLERLVHAGLVLEQGAAPQISYMFKHALIKDAAYNSLLKSKRRALHAEVARALEKGLSVGLSAEPELLAHHYTEAGHVNKAIHYWYLAGQEAKKRLAYIEAQNHLHRGLQLLSQISEPVDKIKHELVLLSTLGPVLMATKGYTAAEVVQVYARAKALCEMVASSASTDLFPVLFGLWGFHLTRAEYTEALKLAEALVNIGERSGDSNLQVEALGAYGGTLFWLGDLETARGILEKAVSIYDPQQHQHHALYYGQDPLVGSAYFLAMTMWCLGEPDVAAGIAQDALAHANEIAHHFSIAFALQAAANVHTLRREPETVKQLTETGLRLSKEQYFPYWKPRLHFSHSWARACTEEYEQGISEMRRSLDPASAMEASITRRPLFAAMLAESLIDPRTQSEGLRVIEQAIDMVAQSDERWCESELHRIKGELLLCYDPQRHQNAAEECFTTAIKISRHQKALSWELRCGTSLARLWSRMGSVNQARKLLVEIVASFPKDLQSKDLQEARTLIEQLG